MIGRHNILEVGARTSRLLIITVCLHNNSLSTCWTSLWPRFAAAQDPPHSISVLDHACFGRFLPHIVCPWGSCARELASMREPYKRGTSLQSLCFTKLADPKMHAPKRLIAAVTSSPSSFTPSRPQTELLKLPLYMHRCPQDPSC